MWYEAIYVVPAAMLTGLAKLTCCQPLAVSFVKVAVASRVPELVHRFPMCVPVFADDHAILKAEFPLYDALHAWCARAE